MGPLEDEAKRVRLALRRVRYPRRQQKTITASHADVFERPPLDGLERQRALELREELLALLQVVVPPLVRPADDHDFEVAAKQQLVRDGRLEGRAVLLEPRVEVHGLHGEPSSCWLQQWARMPGCCNEHGVVISRRRRLRVWILPRNDSAQ